MQTKNQNQKRELAGIIICIIACAIFLGIFFLTSSIKETTTKKVETKTPILTQKTETKTSPPIATKEKGITTVIEINDKKYETLINQETSVYDLMTKMKKEGKIDFEEDSYAGLGKFIKEINGVKNNGDKYWIYYVNGEKAKIGISNYIINGGDTVSWKYEKDLN